MDSNLSDKELYLTVYKTKWGLVAELAEARNGVNIIAVKADNKAGLDEMKRVLCAMIDNTVSEQLTD